jgi:hypothetical protein
VTKILQVLLITLLSLSFGRCLGETDSSANFGIDQALEKYAKAESTTDRSEREKLFNEALKTFLVEATAQPSGKLFYNIGNTYAYLGEYGFAIAFYRKAEGLMPRDPALHQNLQKVIDLAGVSGYQIESPVADMIGLRSFSPLEQHLLLLGLAVFSLVLFSLNVWLPSIGFKWVSRVSIACTLLLIISLASYHFFMPPRAVIVKAAGLRITQMSVNEARFILHPGEMVEVLDMGNKGGLVRVRTATSVTGYLPQEVICIV